MKLKKRPWTKALNSGLKSHKAFILFITIMGVFLSSVEMVAAHTCSASSGISYSADCDPDNIITNIYPNESYSNLSGNSSWFLVWERETFGGWGKNTLPIWSIAPNEWDGQRWVNTLISASDVDVATANLLFDRGVLSYDSHIITMCSTGYAAYLMAHNLAYHGTRQNYTNVYRMGYSWAYSGIGWAVTEKWTAINLRAPLNWTTNNDTFHVTIDDDATNGWTVNSINYSIDGESPQALNLDGNQENYTSDFLSGLGEGQHNITIYADYTNKTSFSILNPANQINMTPRYFTIDKSGPNVTILFPQNRSYYNVTSFNATIIDTYSPWNATGSNYQHVYRVIVDSVNYTLTNYSVLPENQAGGNYSYFNDSLPEGNYIARFYANDTLGNVNFSEEVIFTIDQTPPNVTILSPQSTSYSPGAIWFNITAEDNLGANWTLNVTVQVGDPVSGLKNYSLSNNSGNWNYLNNTNGPPEGSYNATFFVNDSAGNMNDTEVVYFTITSVPVINITSPLNQTYNTNVSFNMTIINNVALSSANVSVNGTNYTMKNTSLYEWNNSAITLGEGTYNATFYADAAGLNSNDTVYFTLDTTPPSVTLISPENNSNTSNSSVTFNFSSVDNFDDFMNGTLYLNGIANRTIYITNDTANTTTIDIPDGNYNWSIDVSDNAPNTNSSDVRDITVDTTPPNITITSPESRRYDPNSAIWFNATIIDALFDVNAASAQVEYDGVNHTLVNSSGNWNHFNDSIPDGSYVAIFCANDTLGNLGCANRSFSLAPAPAEEDGGAVGPSPPRVVVLSNNIDKELAADFFGFLRNKGMDIIHVNASQFDQDKKMYKFVIILGGHEAYDGVGDIVKEILTEEEQDFLEQEGNRKMFTKTNVWRNGQVVYILAGSDRDATAEAHKTFRGQIVVS